MKAAEHPRIWESQNELDYILASENSESLKHRLSASDAAGSFSRTRSILKRERLRPGAGRARTLQSGVQVPSPVGCMWVMKMVMGLGVHRLAVCLYLRYAMAWDPSEPPFPHLKNGTNTASISNSSHEN